jgi:DNA-binding response OmpR family regulator
MNDPAGGGPVVLLIDDDAANRQLLDVLLRREGIVPVCAETGADGLARARERAPDLILLDVFLPGEDGFALLEAIKSDSGLSGVPVVMFTVLGQEKGRRRALERGACAYVMKPFDMNRTVALIRRLLSGEQRCAEVGVDP